VAKEEPSARHRPKLRVSLSTAILIGLTLGIVFGLMVGEYAAPLRTVGNAFIALLQMTVLPYIMVALVASIGALSPQRAWQLAKKAGLLLLAFWALGIAIVMVIPLAFPELTTASFFSTSLVESPRQIDYLKLYIPSNPFHSMANSLIPAVVLFSIAIGVAIIGIKKKAALLEPLSVLAEALTGVNAFVVKLTPAGVFALAAGAAGTLTLEEVGRLQAYMIVYVATAVVVALWVLPALLSVFTPFKGGDVIRVARDALVTAFATDNVFVVLPMLSRRAKTLFEKYGLEHDEIGSSIDVVVPVGYTFPNLGKLMTLAFVPFAGWFIGEEMTLGEYPSFVIMGLLSYFGAVSFALPFLLDQLQIPADMFQLYLLAGIFVGRFGALLGAMNILAFAVLTACLMTRMASFRRRRLPGCLAVTVVAIAAVVIGTRVYLDRAMEGAYRKDEIIAGMQLLEDPAPAVVLDVAAPNPVALQRGQTRLDRIRQRGVIRIGFDADRLPFAFRNDRGDLVGFDIDMAHHLAHDLGVEIEFVPFETSTMAAQLEADHFDLVMSGVAGSPSRYEQMLFTDSYLDGTPALVMKDHVRRKYDTLEELRKAEDLSVGVLDDAWVLNRIRTVLPKARVVAVESHRPFFEGAEGERLDLDMIIISAESGSAWTLLHPEYAVVTTVLKARHWPMGYPIGGRDRELEDFMNNWIYLSKMDGTIQTTYDHWILGRTAEEKKPRWSVIRDVFGWVE
jgi:Na+/H+-dicarboxylate symporter